MSFTPYNAPLLSGLLGDMEIAAHFSVKADIAAMLKFESMLAKAQVETGLISEDHAKDIAATCDGFEPDMKALQQGSAQDGMAVPEFIQQLRGACDREVAASLHFGSTSQDVVDTSLTMRLVEVNRILQARLTGVTEELASLEKRYGERELMARTRMQAALPVNVADRLQQWHRPIKQHLASFGDIKSNLHVVQLGGPVGTLSKMRDNGPEIRAKLAELLELNDPGEVWHTDRARLNAYCNWLCGLCGCLGKLGQDAALMAQNGIEEISFDDAGSSSAMAHKRNPIKAEMLVTIARFAATLNAGMQHNMIHEQERSGAAWTFEWLIIPQLCVATGASLRNADTLLKSITNIA
ncbi:MAG: 3-carboxy-cis,cis-muconate cycloisomerase [Pseudomonadota bacterium]